MTIVDRAFPILSLAACAGLAAVMLMMGEPERPDWWASAGPFALWALGPFLLPWLFARRRPPALRLLLFLYLLLATAVGAWACIDALRSTSSTAGLIFVALPAYQMAGLLAVLLLYALTVTLIGRRRPNS